MWWWFGYSTLAGDLLLKLIVGLDMLLLVMFQLLLTPLHFLHVDRKPPDKPFTSSWSYLHEVLWHIFVYCTGWKRTTSTIHFQRSNRCYYVRGTKRRSHYIGCKFKCAARHIRSLATLYLSLLPPTLSNHLAFASTTNSSTFSSLRNTMPYDTDSFPIKVDNCSTRCMTNSLHDFENGVSKPTSYSLEGITGHSDRGRIRIGTIVWRIEDEQGCVHQVRVPNSLYVPDIRHRLLCPQHWGYETGDIHREISNGHHIGTWCATLPTSIKLYWDQNRFSRTIPLDYNSTNVGTIYSAPGYTAFACSAHVSDDEDDDPSGNAGQGNAESSSIVPNDANHDDITQSHDSSTPAAFTTLDFDIIPPDTANMNEHETSILYGDQQEDDRNDNFESPASLWTYWHHKLGHLPNNRMRTMAANGELPKILKDCRIPLCTSCIYGKLTRKAWRTKAPLNKTRTRTITQPGACVSVDQMESTTPGFIAQMKGGLTTKRYRAMTVFVDQFSGLSFVYAQQRLTSLETVQAKHAFERFAKSHGVFISSYHADNGRFADNMFIQDCERQQQSITYCGVNAHHQNGIAEKKIRDLQDSARTMMIHANRRWPDAIVVNLWPYAIKMANDVSNATTGITGKLTPIELFANSGATTALKTFNTFGSPTYVLDKNMQAGKKLPKWHERARVGIHLGHSISHARSVSLVLSLQTGLVSPQFHVKHDDRFETLRSDSLTKPPKSQWQRMAGFTGAPRRATSTVTEGAAGTDFGRLLGFDDHFEQFDQTLQENEGAPIIQETEGATLIVDEQLMTEFGSSPDAETPITPRPGAAQMIDPSLRRSSRIPQPSRKFLESLETSHISFEANVCLDVEEELEIDLLHPLAFATSSDPDIMHVHQALRQPDREQFIEAMQKEIQDHEKRKHWVLVKRNQIPSNMRVLPAVWSMRRKRRIDTREVYKWKARLTIHGGKQEFGINYWETYSPVVKWSTIRLFLTLTLLSDWKTRQLDFVLAFPQAPVECDLYMEVPMGYKMKGNRNPKDHALKLLKNLYGQKQAGRVWYEYLSDKLLANGFTQSNFDPCVFYHKDCVLLIYVDDTIVCGRTDQAIADVVTIMKSLFDVDDQGDLADYLGVKIEHHKDGRISLTQPHLIDQILNDLHFQSNTKPADTPAFTTRILQPDDDGTPFDNHFHYRSVIGKLNFLEKSTRPDIAYAVHQCARFSANPKQSHAIAVKRIGRYLLATRDKGITMQPRDHSFDCWVDADFVGNWNPDIAMEDIGTAKSRSGGLITYAGCPLLWLSKLQTEVALSTTEAEYISLSTALREVIPLMNLCEEIKKKGWKLPCTQPTIHCTVFEDNEGAYELARMPKMRPRTKHINVKYHHFRHHVKCGKISIKKVRTTDQLADCFTKMCATHLFRKFRLSFMGWDTADSTDRGSETLSTKNVRTNLQIQRNRYTKTGKSNVQLRTKSVVQITKSYKADKSCAASRAQDRNIQALCLINSQAPKSPSHVLYQQSSS